MSVRIITLVLLGVALCSWRAASRFGGHTVGTAKSGRFAVTQSGKTVLDRSNGLVWERAYSPKPLDWQSNKDRCSQNGPGLPGSGWRLPNRAELLSLVDSATLNPAIDPVFTATPSETFWSTTPLAKSAELWLVEFKTGQAVAQEAKTAAFGRCVR
ncbi:MAG: DUF1566 domain-containing protein [Myxococcales bacterium]|nr:DUF1566 domain-containing protein [Myxococcales bacterium]